jgi:hypothetical protein
MGGKGGDGGGQPGWYPVAKPQFAAKGVDLDQYLSDPNYKAQVDANNGYGATYNPDGTLKSAAAPAAAPAPTPDAAPAPAPAPAPDPTPSAPPGPSGPLSSAGSKIAQPAASGNPTPTATGGVGDAMGSSVTNPPKYWVGGVDQYNTANPASPTNKGAMKTTTST